MSDEIAQIIADVTPERVESLIESFENMVGPLNDEFSIEYELVVNGYTVTGVKSKARLYTRAKNPFEPEIVEIKNISDQANLEPRVPGMTSYLVTTSVTK